MIWASDSSDFLALKSLFCLTTASYVASLASSIRLLSLSARALTSAGAKLINAQEATLGTRENLELWELQAGRR